MTPDPAPPPEPTSQPEAAKTAPAVSDRALWLEVFAVLSVGYFPYLTSSIVHAVQPAASRMYWLDALAASVYSACAIFVVLYLISRSGEPWAAFGVTRPDFGDLLLGLTLFAADFVVAGVIRSLLPDDPAGWLASYPWPRPGVDYLLLAVREAMNGFGEELVMRAYLITRLERLLGSRLQAVLLSAVLFTSYHLHYGPGGGLLSILAFGLLFGAAYLLLRRVWPLALAHMLTDVYLALAGVAG
jgi:membrane protease YdiL (CAAX protease family)